MVTGANGKTDGKSNSKFNGKTIEATQAFLAETSTIPIFEAKMATDTKGYRFCSWQIATTNGYVELNKPVSIKLNTACRMSIASKEWIANNALNTIVKPMEEPFTICGIGSDHLSTSYVLINLHLPGTHNGKTAIAKIRTEIYIVDQLPAGILIGMDILGPYKFILDPAGQSAYI